MNQPSHDTCGNFNVYSEYPVTTAVRVVVLLLDSAGAI